MGGFIQTPALIGEDHCWRENFDDHGGGIAGTQNHLFPDDPPGNSACVGSRYVGPPGTPIPSGYTIILISPELESPPTSVSFSIFSYGIYCSNYLGDSLRRRLAVGYIADTNDWRGSFVGVDTVEFTADRLVWEPRFTHQLPRTPTARGFEVCRIKPAEFFSLSTVRGGCGQSRGGRIAGVATRGKSAGGGMG